MIRADSRCVTWAIPVILFAILTATNVCFAQSDTARLQGTVTDAQGAAISGASVLVTSTQTGFKTTVTTK